MGNKKKYMYIYPFLSPIRDSIIYSNTSKNFFISKKNNIKYTYIFAGPFDTEGFLPSYSFSETAINSVKLLKHYYPEIVILPWIGGIQNKTVFLNDSLWVKNVINDSKRLINIDIFFSFSYFNEFVYKLNRRYFGDRIFDRLVIASITVL